MTLATSSTSTYPVLSNGSTGEDVQFLQALLNRTGYPVAIDGFFGPQTEAAVQQFQQDQHLTVDGIVGSQTWTALLPPTLRRGSTGQEVRTLQISLNFFNYGPLVEDGIFGPKTEAAVKQFQQDQHLTVDGIVGYQTWKALLALED